MKASFCIPGEQVLEQLEREIIEEKIKAYRLALEKIFPTPLLLQPYVADYKRKLQRQFEALFNTAKEIYLDPDRKERILRLNFRKYYEKTPLYSMLLLQIPPIFAPNFIRTMLRQLKRLNRRYFKRRVNILLFLFEKLQKIETETHSEDEFLRRIFEDKRFMIEYIYTHIEIEKKKYRIIKKGGDWNQIPISDYLHGSTLTSISFYQYVSNIWKTLSEFLAEFLEQKIADLYHLRTLEDDKLEILKRRKYRYKLVKEFPRPPQVIMEIFHDPETLLRNYPSKETVKIERLASNRIRYRIQEKLPFMKIELIYELVWRFDGFLEEWWIENSNYVNDMHGFAIYEETPDGNCRYADILIDFSLNTELKPFEDVIIPELERIGKKKIEQLMENIYQELISQDRTMVHQDQDECRELG